MRYVRPQQHGEEEGGGHSVGLWYVSFADMIMLLLAFFVMLSTFSSYDQEARTKFAGACYYIASNSVFPAREIPHQAFAQILPPVVNFTQAGAEKPNELDDEDVPNPLRLEVQDNRAFYEQKVLSLPAKTLYNRDGQLTDDGIQLLAKLGEYLRRDPCAVLVAYPPNGESAAAHIGAAYRAERAYTVLKHLADAERIPAAHLGMYQPPAAQSNPYAGEPILEITLRNGGIFR
ncbi:MAG: hypothetical protein FWE88_07275 [Phycisphaerae bacterium]|nr:hypothetical protein [Phycisphaerae bacterium]